MVIPWVIAAIAIGDLKISGLDLDILIDTLEKRVPRGADGGSNPPTRTN
jgi:hypothetical protein